jgi:hypothetical protein
MKLELFESACRSCGSTYVKRKAHKWYRLCLIKEDHNHIKCGSCDRTWREETWEKKKQRSSELFEEQNREKKREKAVAEGNFMSTWEQAGIPNPGSALAETAGCLCPVLDNNHGEGIICGFGGTPENPVFWINQECLIHNLENIKDPTIKE